MKNKISLFTCLTFLILLLSSCEGGNKKKMTLSGLDPDNFESLVDGKEVKLYVLKNSNGVEVTVTNYGGRIVSVMVPDKNGKLQDVVLGFDNMTDYLNIPSDFGATIGRYANRINQGKIVLEEDTIQLPTNNYGHTLHGGPNGWQYKVFDANQPDETTIQLSLESPDGDEGFPGNVKVNVTFKLTENNAIDISYSATTDKKTIINMTNHSYFNLSGNPENTVLNDILYVNADQYTPVDETFMTTGEILPVEGTPMDFTSPKAIGQEINNYDFEQLKNGDGYDHNWVLNTNGDVDQIAAKLKSPESGIVLEVYTNEPGIQVYTGNFLEGIVKGKKEIIYSKRSAVCLEVQHYPDSPNKPEWPSVILEPGQQYVSRCIYKFSVEH